MGGGSGGHSSRSEGLRENKRSAAKNRVITGVSVGRRVSDIEPGLLGHSSYCSNRLEGGREGRGGGGGGEG